MTHSNRYKLIILFLLWCQTFPAFAQKGGTIALKDPFKSWLPKIEEPMVEIKTKTEVKKTATPTAPEKKSLPLPFVPVQPPELQVTGIVWGDVASQAIVNGQVVAIGDIIQNS